MIDHLILVRGGGDLATGVIWCLHQSGFRILVSEIDKPTCIRRTVSICDAMYDDSAEIEGMAAVKISSLNEAEAAWNVGKIPVIVDPSSSIGLSLKPDVMIDAIIAKVNTGTSRDMAPFVIGLGPGFEAGKDVDVVIETSRGHDLGRLIFKGSALPDTHTPGIIAGYGIERVIHSPAAGIFTGSSHIGDIVSKGDIIADVDGIPVYATIDGVLRGILRTGLAVPEGFKIADIDPRITEVKNYSTISDKARALGGAALTAVCMYYAGMYKRDHPV